MSCPQQENRKFSWCANNHEKKSKISYAEKKIIKSEQTKITWNIDFLKYF